MQHLILSMRSILANEEVPIWPAHTHEYLENTRSMFNMKCIAIRFQIVARNSIYILQDQRQRH